MATINASTNEKVIPLRKWLGLNQHPDGDTMLKVGEASTMKNFRITRDGNLKRRPGSDLVFGLCAAYTLTVSETETTLFTIGEDKTVTVYTNAAAEQVSDLNSVSRYTGRIALSTSSTIDSEGAIDVLEDLGVRYLHYDDFDWKLSSVTQKGSKYVWKGFKLSLTKNGTHHAAGLWSGIVGGKEVLLAACDGNLWSLYDSTTDTFIKTWIGPVYPTALTVSFFPFDNKVYILDGFEFYEWDGVHTLSNHITISSTAWNVDAASATKLVEGYRPLVAITLQPMTTVDNESVPGAYELTGEYVNRLNGQRRVWLSPDGANATFQLPEKASGMTIDYVKDLATGNDLQPSAYTFVDTTGQLTFTTTPTEDVNSYEVAYTMPTDGTLRTQVTHNRFAELFAGTTDTRIFLYGDGTNRALYSGMDYDGQPRPDYFPDQYEVRVGDENTPITAMIRHYSALATYKTDSAWSLTHGVIQLATDDLTPAVYSVPVNRDIGNLAPGQVRLVNNNPVTLFGKHIYQWSNSSYYTSNLTRDERQARRISDRVQAFAAEMDWAQAMMWDDNDHQELYISQNGTTLVLNYAQDVWYEYDIAPVCMVNFQGDLYYGDGYGWFYKLDEDAESDNGTAIDAEWMSGAMDFGADYMRKYAAMLWVGLKPAEDTSVWVTVKTDRKDTFKEKLVPSTKAKVQGEPFVVKTKLKAKKFVYYRLLFESNEKAPPVTVTSADIRVRTTGYAK